MLTVRLATPVRDVPQPLALAARRAIEQRAFPLDGTVLLGTGDPLAIHPGDSGPHVVVPLALGAPPGALGRAQVNLADAVVVLHRDEADLLHKHIDPRTPVLVVRDGVGDPLIAGANPEENLQALAALAEHPDLASHIGAWRPPESAIAKLAADLADAVAEAAIAASRRV